MKFVYLFLFIFGFSLIAKAEYDSFVIQFEITTSQNEIINGYQQVYGGAFYNREQSDSTLIFALYANYTTEDSLYFATNKIEYTVYYDLKDEDAIYTELILMDEASILRSDIESIEILDYEWKSTLEGCYFSYEFDDLSWLENKPVEIFNYTPYCDFSFFIHEWSPDLRAIMKDIDTIDLTQDDAYDAVDAFQDQISRIRNEKVVIYQGW